MTTINIDQATVLADMCEDELQTLRFNPTDLEDDDCDDYSLQQECDDDFEGEDDDDEDDDDDDEFRQEQTPAVKAVAASPRGSTAGLVSVSDNDDHSLDSSSHTSSTASASSVCCGGEESSSSTGASSPEGLNPADIVCGRDKLSHSHEGNKRFRKIIQSYRRRYQTATRREEKTRITGEIVALVEKSGGRFLKTADDEPATTTTTPTWVEVDAAGIHEKVSHALRSARDPNQIKTKRRRSDATQVPSPEENAVFKRLLSTQRAAFLRLVDQCCDEEASCRIQLSPMFSEIPSRMSTTSERY